MKISNNISALQSYTNLLKTNRNIDKAMVKVSSGYKINSVKDDAAGMAISNKLRNQIKGMEMAARNSMDGISLVQTAEGALQEVHNMLQRIRELAVAAANDTLEEEDKEKSQLEVEQLLSEIKDTSYKTEFNAIKVLNGEASAESFTDAGGNIVYSFLGLKLQIGANRGMELNVTLPNIQNGMNQSAINAGILPDASGKYVPSVATHDDATIALGFCDEAISFVSEVRSRLGAYQNRLEHTYNNLMSINENTQSALSRVFDTDVALEMSKLAQNNIISQAGISILGQANQRPQQILSLLQ